MSRSSSARPAASGARLLGALAMACILAVLANLVVAAVAHSAGASDDFQQLQAATVSSLTLLGVLVGALGWALVRSRASRPHAVLRILVPAVLVLSFVPDLLLGRSDQPGTSWGAVAALMTMHLIVAAIAIPAYSWVMPLPADRATDGHNQLSSLSKEIQMRALHVPAAGEQPQLSDLPTPEVADGTVLIRVKAAGLNPIDNGIAAGMMTAMLPHEYPLVLGRDASGIVEAVGAGVDHVQAGDEVFGHVLLAPPIKAGTLAEYALLPGAAVAKKPAGVDFVTAAALPLAGAAAHAAVAAIDPQPGQSVLVNGAAGGVGLYAIQMLDARGVTVVATGTPVDAERLQKLGAHTVVDYTTGSVVDQVRAAHPEGVDALINLFGTNNDDVPLGAVRAGGSVASTTMAPDADSVQAAGLTGHTVMAGPVREIIEPLAEQVAAGTLRVHVENTLPLEQAADGLAALAAGYGRGKTVVIVQN